MSLTQWLWMFLVMSPVIWFVGWAIWEMVAVHKESRRRDLDRW